MFIKKSNLDLLIEDMLTWRIKAHTSYCKAKEVQAAYTDKYERGGYKSRVDAEVHASRDNRFVVAVQNNQMYDRFATRDAAVLSAIASLTTAGLLTIRPE